MSQQIILDHCIRYVCNVNYPSQSKWLSLYSAAAVQLFFEKNIYILLIRFIELPETGEMYNRKFNYSCEVEDRKSTATCSSKKGAKEKAAKALFDEIDCLFFKNVEVPTLEVTIDSVDHMPANSVGTLITMCQQRKLQKPV